MLINNPSLSLAHLESDVGIVQMELGILALLLIRLSQGMWLDQSGSLTLAAHDWFLRDRLVHRGGGARASQTSSRFSPSLISRVSSPFHLGEECLEGGREARRNFLAEIRTPPHHLKT